MSQVAITKLNQSRTKRKPAAMSAEPPAWFVKKLEGALKELRATRKRIQRLERETKKIKLKSDAAIERLKRI